MFDGYPVDVYSNLNELRRYRIEGRDFRILSCDRQSEVSIVSPHGGLIEAGTSCLAAAIAGDTFNHFDFQGLLEGDNWDLHITATRFREPSLIKMLRWSRFAVAIHGMGVTDSMRIWTGGLNLGLKFSIESLLRQSGFVVLNEPPRYRGESPANIVNLPGQRGVQLEIPDDLMASFFSGDCLFSRHEPGPVLSSLGEIFVRCVRQAIYLHLPSRTLAYVR
ncbi:MAG: hypothetical protein GC193_05330 [Cryomorphaceae bacterium]|nr:hypothetical protein [Cryomorphaceae bacterium]